MNSVGKLNLSTGIPIWAYNIPWKYGTNPSTPLYSFT